MFSCRVAKISDPQVNYTRFSEVGEIFELAVVKTAEHNISRNRAAAYAIPVGVVIGILSAIFEPIDFSYSVSLSIPWVRPEISGYSQS